ncbi:MAG TPA: hypothetical protein VN224_13135 [Xanthomonadales bacterium]|nr:hypothetical protein [Xanthomonadales bacterium]
MSSPIVPDDEGLLRDLTRESWTSFVAMPRWAQATLVLGMVTHLAASLPILPPHLIPDVWLASIRVAAFVAMVVGVIENAKTYDEFYARVYLDACAVTLVLSTVILYAAWNFGVDFGLRTVSLILAIFVIAFVAAFARLRRRA